MKHGTIRKGAICAGIAAVIAVLPAATAKAADDDGVKSEISRSFYNMMGGEFNVPWDGYSGVKQELINDICKEIRKDINQLEVDEETIWCSDKNPMTNTYMLIGSFTEGEDKYYFSAIYEENGDEVFLSEFHSTFRTSPGMIFSDQRMRDETMNTLIEITEEILLNTFPDAEVRYAYCTKVVGQGVYTANIAFYIDGKVHSMKANFEFEGAGRKYTPRKFHLFSAEVDGESVFAEEKQFKHSPVGGTAESAE